MPETKSEDKPIVSGQEREELAQISPASPTESDNNKSRAKKEDQPKDVTDSTLGDDERLMKRKAPQKSAPLPKAVQNQASGAGAARSVGGKTFNNVGGIWFDAAYGKQKQKTVRRGTSEYLRLDAGLRSIADSLGGTVVILWGGKAYRIQ